MKAVVQRPVKRTDYTHTGHHSHRRLIKVSIDVRGFKVLARTLLMLPSCVSL